MSETHPKTLKDVRKMSKTPRKCKKKHDKICYKNIGRKQLSLNPPTPYMEVNKIA